MTSVIIPGLLAGALGSFHCVGMCGPIALALPVQNNNPVKKFLSIMLYNAGRALTYSVYGTLAGLAGEALVMASSGRILSATAGLLIVLSVVLASPATPRFLRFSAFSRLSSAISAILRKRNQQGLFLLGILNGMLPCGLVYMTLSLSVATGSAWNGAVLMAMFGLGTVPVMTLMPYLGNFISISVRAKMRKTVPVFIVGMGMLLILRGLALGIPFVSPATGAGQGSCHTANNAQNNSIKQIRCIGHD